VIGQHRVNENPDEFAVIGIFYAGIFIYPAYCCALGGQSTVTFDVDKTVSSARIFCEL